MELNKMNEEIYEEPPFASRLFRYLNNRNNNAI